MSESAFGGFDSTRLTDTALEGVFVTGEVKGLTVQLEVEYKSSRGYTHTGELSVVERRLDDGSISRITNPSPDALLKVYVSEIGQSILIDMPYKSLIELGEFTSLTGKFGLTTEEIDVKLCGESVVVDGFGEFPMIESGEVSNSCMFSSWRMSKSFTTFDWKWRCNNTVNKSLRDAWATDVSLDKSEWEIISVTDSEYTPTAELEISPENKSVIDSLSVSLHPDDVSEKPQLQELIESDGDGLVSNLEGVSVVVSIDVLPHSNCVFEVDGWRVYRKSQRVSLDSKSASLMKKVSSLVS